MTEEMLLGRSDTCPFYFSWLCENISDMINQ